MTRGIALVVVSLTAALAVGASAAAGDGGPGGKLPKAKKGAVGSPHVERGSSADPSSSTTIPFWSSQFTDPTNRVTYRFSMVGTNPATGASTTVPVVIVPLKVVYKTPTTATNDGTGRVAAVTQSPIFQTSTYTLTGDTDQYGSAFMRAQFDTFGGYRVELASPTVAQTQELDVPTQKGEAVAVASDGSVVGVAQSDWFRHELSKLVTSMHTDPRTLVLFLGDDTYLYDGNDPTAPGACCALGYHTAEVVKGPKGARGVQTYLFASWISPGVFTGGFDCSTDFSHCEGETATTPATDFGDAVLSDIHVLSHEVAEWLADPFGLNLVQPWSVPTAPLYGCQNVLETGDPVVGVGWEQPLNGFVYHPEDEAFKSWFARERPSTAYGGTYTFMGSHNPFGFDTYPAPTC